MFLLVFLLMGLVSLEAMKIPPQDDSLETLLSELQPGMVKRIRQIQRANDPLVDYPFLYSLYGLEKRRLMPYSGGIFGR